LTRSKLAKFPLSYALDKRQFCGDNVTLNILIIDRREKYEVVVFLNFIRPDKEVEELCGANPLLGGGGEGPRSRRYGRTAALRLLVQPYDEDEDDDYYFLSFS
jgi:hypothetical protein